MFGITIRNEVNQSEKLIGFSFRMEYVLSADVMCRVFVKVSHHIYRFYALETLTVIIHSVKMAVGFGGEGIKRKGRSLAARIHLKRSIEGIGAEETCLMNPLIIAITRLNNDPN